jgi:Helix-turn-helix domain
MIGAEVMTDRASLPPTRNPFDGDHSAEEAAGSPTEASDAFAEQMAPTPGALPRTTADGIAARAHSGPRTFTKKEAFNHQRHQWLGLLARDGKMTGAALRVAILIWQHQNVERGYAWPSLDYLSLELNVYRSTVTRAIKLLENRGWITVERLGGRHRSNRYRPAFGSMEDG